MTYILSLGTPVRYEADNDDHARVIAEHIEDTILATSLPHGAVFQDDAPGYLLFESMTGRLRGVVEDTTGVQRYAPFPASTGAGHPPCPACQDYIRASHTPAAGDAGISIETIGPEVDQPADQS